MPEQYEATLKETDDCLRIKTGNAETAAQV